MAKFAAHFLVALSFFMSLGKSPVFRLIGEFKWAASGGGFPHRSVLSRRL